MNSFINRLLEPAPQRAITGKPHALLRGPGQAGICIAIARIAIFHALPSLQ